LKRAGQPLEDPRFRWCPMRRGFEFYKNRFLDDWNFLYVVDKETEKIEVLVDVGDGQDITGSDFAGVWADISYAGDPIVSFQMKPEAEARFARLTRPENRRRFLAIILDGVIQSAPMLLAQLSTGGIIEGYRGDIRERDEVVWILDSGPLGVRLGDPVLEERFGPGSGVDSVKNSSD